MSQRLALFLAVAAVQRDMLLLVLPRPNGDDALSVRRWGGAGPLGSATADGDASHDNGSAFARVAAATGIEELRTAYRAPRQHATCERFLGSVRRECLDHILVLGEAHLRRILQAYVHSFNTARPHQGLQQGIPDRAAGSLSQPRVGGRVRAVPVLGGLHHAYRRVP